MDYGFGELHGKEVFRGKKGLSGKQVIVERYEDCVITHKFTIRSALRTAASQCWYAIDSHTTVVDKSDALQTNLDKTRADLEYLSMMTGIDLDEEVMG